MIDRKLEKRLYYLKNREKVLEYQRKYRFEYSVPKREKVIGRMRCFTDHAFVQKNCDGKNYTFVCKTCGYLFKKIVHGFRATGISKISRITMNDLQISPKEEKMIMVSQDE